MTDTGMALRTTKATIGRNGWRVPFGFLLLPLMIIRPSLDNVLGIARLQVGPASLSTGFLFNVLIVAIAGLLATHALLVDRRRQRSIVLVTVMWGPFLVAAMLALLHSPDLVDATQVLFNYSTYAAASFIGITYGMVLNRQQLTKIVLLSGIVPIFYGLLQVFTNTAGHRLASTFAHPNIFAFFLLIYISFLYHAAISYGFKHSYLIIISLIITISTICLLLTGTRSAYVALYAFLVLYSIFRNPILLLPLAVLPVVALLIPEVRERVLDVIQGRDNVSYEYLTSVMRGDVSDSESIAVDSGTWRKFLWLSSLPWIERSPVFGYGLASFPTYIRDFFPLAEEKGAAHNVYIQMAFEGGLVLLVSYFNMLAVLFKISIDRIISKHPDGVFIFLISIVFFIASFSDNMLHYLIVQVYFYFILCFLIQTGARFSVGSDVNKSIIENRVYKMV